MSVFHDLTGAFVARNLGRATCVTWRGVGGGGVGLLIGVGGVNE